MPRYIGDIPKITIEGGFPAGAILSFAMASPPPGWLVCDGSALSRAIYVSLFTEIGTTWGVGDGSTTFNLPDLRGEFLRGFDNGAGNDPDAATRTGGDAVGSSQVDEFKSHSGHFIGPVGAGGAYITPGNIWILAAESKGGAETRPRNIAVQYCIKY